MKRLNPALHPPIAKVLVLICAIAIVSYVILKPRPVAAAGPFNVNSTLDLPDLIPGDGLCNTNVATCTLRAAIMEANATAGADTINVPAGTYTLTRGPFDDEFLFNGANEGTGDLDVVGSDLTINGAGAGVTIIDGGSLDRVFDVNNFAGPGAAVNLTLQNLTVRNGSAKTGTAGYFHSGGAIQFDGLDYLSTFSPAGVTLTLTNCVISSNSAAGNGGAISIFNGGSLNISNTSFTGNQSLNASGGAIMFDGAPDPGTRTLSITNSSFANNTATNATFGSGGGIWAAGNANLTIENNSFSNNAAGVDGGGIWSQAFLASNTKAINKNSLTGNSAKTGGGIYDSAGVLTFNFNVVVGNTATTLPTSSGLRHAAGIANADNNWWGCNAGPSASPCDRALGVISLGAWLKLSHTASPNAIAVNQSSTLQADFFTNNMGASIAASDLVALNGRAVTFNNAVLGTISGADPTINAGKANATFNAGATPGSGSADATVDQATVTASINISQAAEVTTNPTDQTVCEGGTATFTASASGSPAPTVQWQVSTGGPFADIPGATSTTLSFTATASQNGNQYRAVFTNAGGTATTTAATLTVNTAPTVTTNPTDQTVCEGQTASFTAAANSSPAATVQWQVSSGGPFANVPGATSTTLSFTATNAQNGNQYRAVFTNTCGSTNTTAATLTVQPSTTTSDPSDQTVCQGASASFSTTAGGTGPFTYSWTLDGSPFGGNTSSISVPTGSLSVGNHTVSVTTTGTCGSASQSATLTVQENTSTSDPADQTVCQGASASFSTTAGGTGPFTYAWTLDGSPFGGNTSSINVPTGSLSVGNHTVSVTTTGTCGSASQSATLTVQENTSTSDPSDQTVCQGASASFSTTAGGTGPFTYAWTVDGSPAGNTSSISVPTSSLSIGSHTVSVTTTGTCGSASQSATLTVQENTSTSDPSDQTVCQGASASFSTTAGGTGPFTYAWTLDGSPFGGNTSSINVPTGSLSVGNHTVSVTATGTCGSASQSATLTVNAPTSTTDPADQTVCQGATANFSTTASGTGPFSYAWTVDGLPYGGNSSSIAVNTTGFSQGAHTVTVTTTGSCGSASQSATLTVSNSPPTITATTSNINVWPPNHQYQSFTAADFGITASSGCNGNLTNSVVIASVSSDEPEDSAGADGSTLNDIVIAADCKSLQLRRERDGNLNGRVYTIIFKVTDSVGQTSTVTVTVSVPLNHNGSAAVNNGPAAGYTVNSLCP